MRIITAILVLSSILYFGCSASDKQTQSDKINFDLSKFDNEGYRTAPDGSKSSAHYEFCIPASDSVLAEILSIDPDAGVMKGSKGRSGCSDKEWLVVSPTRKAGFKDIIKKLAALQYIRKISETYWE